MRSESVLDTSTVADPMLPRLFRVQDRRQDTADTATLWLSALDGGPFEFRPGQFTMLQAFGVGEVPISISGDPADPSVLQHTIRDVGGVTRALVAARAGDVLGVRGPYGTSWAVEDGRGGDVLVVAGGIGLAPLRPALLQLLAGSASFGRTALLYGARSPADGLYSDELASWRDGAGLAVETSVDHAPAGYDGYVGLVTDLLERVTFDPARTVALVCGPEVMIGHVAHDLLDLGVPAAQVRISLERTMQCGVGLCGHCQLRNLFLCVDGPVVRLDQVQDLMNIREL